MAHKAIGVSLPHSSGSQGSGGKAVANMAAALPGDVVCYSGHVGIYIGGGQMIHAPDFGQTVKSFRMYTDRLGLEDTGRKSEKGL